MFGKARCRLWTRVALTVAAAGAVASLSLAAPESTPPPSTTTSARVPVRLDLNAATKASLARLPGIGDAYAQAIIDHRPYKTTAELQTRKILPKDVYDAIEPLVLVRPK